MDRAKAEEFEHLLGLRHLTIRTLASTIIPPPPDTDPTPLFECGGAEQLLELSVVLIVTCQ